MNIFQKICVISAAGLLLSTSGAVGQNAGSPTIQFNRDIRPILSDKCFSCHGPDKNHRMTEFHFDLEETAKQDIGGGRFAIVPGDPAKSAMIQRITAADEEVRMPPSSTGRTLSEREISLLKEWIQQGAKWEKHWSFTPPQRPQAPQVQNSSWVRNPIDNFVLHRLELEGLKPSREADRETLLRRVTLDLTGLPPTPREVETFLADQSPAAYERVVDRLLASSRYGERMAQPWLDAARYADTNGYQLDRERSMWRWRDWVINAFNSNKPFNQFTIEQIAGDLLPNPTLDQRIATGFNRNHRINAEGGIIGEEYRAEYVVDRVATTASVFLGVTMGCARCHDHKYDPFTQKEFYQLYAYFNNIDEPGKGRRVNSEPYIKAPTPQQQGELTKLESQRGGARKRYSELESEFAAGEDAWLQTLTQPVEWQPSEGLVTHYLAEPTTFDGVGFVDGGDVGDFEGDDAFSLSAWIYPTTGDGAILTRSRESTRGGEQGYGLYLSDGKVQMNIASRPDSSLRVITQQAIELGRWHHVTATYAGIREARRIKVYVDGKLQPMEVLFDNFNLESGVKEPFRIGSGGGAGNRFHGQIKGVRVYRLELSPEATGILSVSRSVSELASVPREQRTTEESGKIRNAFAERGASQQLRDAYRGLERAQSDVARFEASIQTVMVMEELTSPRETHVLLRGSYDQPGDLVTPGVPAIFGSIPKSFPSNRLGLAEWLVDPSNPLTARVAVNRFWQMYFGMGLVKTGDDFGSQGEAPSHPELLDWLATEFIRTGWDVKAMQKSIVMSAVYRQDSRANAESLQRDPENRLLARGPRFRLAAEAIRDQALFAAGLLVEKVGGPSVKPYQAEGLWTELNNDEKYDQDHGESLYRRSLYTYWKRTIPPPTMANFDASSRESCVVQRGLTNSPLQALNLMNNVTFIEAARVLAERMMKEGGSAPEDRIAFAFRLATGRLPSTAERQVLSDSFRFTLDRYAAQPDAATKYLRVGEFPRDEKLNMTELAAYSNVASLILNLDETITKE